MAFSDPILEARLKGVKTTATPKPSYGGFSDPVLEARLKTPSVTVSNQTQTVSPVAKPKSNFISTVTDNAKTKATGLISKAKEYLTPKKIIKGLEFAFSPVKTITEAIVPEQKKISDIKLPKIEAPKIQKIDVKKVVNEMFTKDNVVKSLKTAYKYTPLGMQIEGAKTNAKAVPDFIRGFFGEYNGSNEDIGRNVGGKPFEPKNPDQKVGAFAYSLIESVWLGQSTGLNQMFSQGTELFLNIPKVQFVGRVISDLTSKKVAQVINFFEKSPLTFQDIQDVTRGTATPDKIAQYIRAKESGVLDTVIKSYKASGGNPKVRIYDYIKSNIDDAVKYLKSMLTPKEVKLLESGAKNNIEEIIGTGEKTSSDLIKSVVENGLDKTDEGREIIKVALEAQKNGVNINVSTVIKGMDTPAKTTTLGEDKIVYRGAKDHTIDVTRPQGITNGVSFSLDKAVSERFAERSGGTVKEAIISKDAKVIDLSRLEKIVEDVPIIKKNEVATKYLKDNNIDVVRVDLKAGQKGESELIVVNDRVLKVSDVVSQKTEALKSTTGGLEPKDIEKTVSNRITNEKITEETRKSVLNGEKENLRLTEESQLKIAKGYSNNNLLEDATPDTLVKVYRADVSGQLDNGDFVTLDKVNAERYLTEREGSKIMTAEVPLRDLVRAGGLNSEFIYAPVDELKKVSGNLQKNNEGLSKTDADAMAKDVIANRTESKYKTTLNLQNKDDVKQLERIFSKNTVEDIISGKTTNWQGKSYEDLGRVNIVNKPYSKPELKIEPYEGTTTFYHGTSPDNIDSIMSKGFIKGSDLPEDAFRSGGYGQMQNSISFSSDPKMASRFTGQGSTGALIEVKLKPNANIVTVKDIEYAEDLNDYVDDLIKQKIDAVWIGGGEKELVVLNPKSISPVKFEEFKVADGYKPQITAKDTPLSPTEKGVTTQAQKDTPLSLEPTKSKKSKDISKEVDTVGLDERVAIKLNRNQTGEYEYSRPLVGKTEINTLLKNSDEFRANPVLTVTDDMQLSFKGEYSKFTLNPNALNLSTKNLKAGDKIRIDEKAFKEKGASMQTRIYKDGQPLGFNPKNLEDPFSPKATEELKKIVKQSEIAQMLSEKLNVPIRRGKFRMAGALGIYKPTPKVVRIKSGGLQTVFHEVAHFLDDTIGFSDKISVEERKNLMQEYGFDYNNQPNKQKKEAFAEYLRFKMTGQNEKVLQWSPKFDKEFTEKIQTMPDLARIIDDATILYKRWAEQPATAKVLSQISIGKQPKPSLPSRVVSGLHDLYTMALDDLHPLNEFSNLARTQVKDIGAEADPYILARNLRGWTGKAELFLNKGTFGKTFWEKNAKGKTVMKFKGKSYAEIMKPVEQAGNLDDFRVYIISQRIVNDLAPRGIKSGISLQDAESALAELNAKHPEFEAIAMERRKFKDELMEFARDNGLIGEKGLKQIRELNKYHVPFYRVMEQVQGGFMGKSKVAGNINSPIKRIKGSEREIIDPFESDVKDVYAIINASERNNIGIAMANISKLNSELGRLFEEVDKPMKATKVNVKEVFEGINKLTGEEIDVPEDLAELAVTIFRPTQATGANMLNVNMGDTQKVFEVDPDLFKAIQGLNAEDAGIIMKILSLPAKALRLGATLSPDFSVRNPFRDQFSAFVYSKHGFVPAVDLFKGIFELYKKGDVYNLWKAGGGEHATMVSIDREALQDTFKQILKSKGALALDYVKNPIEILKIFSEIGEMGTRLGEMKSALRAGENPIASAFASREITLDFARVGAKTKAMNMITAFWNASLQGTDKMVRSFKDKPFRTLFKTLLSITLPSILLYEANKDDPRWKEIPQWQKNLFWIVLTDKHIWRIPKPFELGVIFGSVPERALEVLDTKDPEMFKELQKAIVDGFAPAFLPTGLIPVIENITNYSFFQDRPIVNRGAESLPPEAQYGAYTSETAKILGEALKYSPAKIDNLVQGYTGGLGKYAVAGMDKILKGTGVVVVPTEPTKVLEDKAVIKAFLVREPIGSGSESVNRVYNMYAKTSAELALVKKLVKLGDEEKAKKYVEKYPDVAYAGFLTNVVESFSDMNKAVDAIKRDKNMTADEKRIKIREIGVLQTDLAQKALNKIKESEAEQD